MKWMASWTHFVSIHSDMVPFSWRGPKWSWLVEFSEMHAIFCNQTQTLIGGQINQEVIKIEANSESN